MSLPIWKEYRLDEVIDKFIDYRGKTPPKTTQGIPLITAKIIKGGRIIEPTEFIAVEDYEQWMTRGFPEVNDVVLTTEAPLGEIALIKDKNVALAQRIITLQTKKEVCHNIFLKYYLQGYEGQARLQARASGSTVEGIKAAELKKMEINLPVISEQIAIANVLTSLDDKIDLLHRQNKTLEQLVETLFRQWFVVNKNENWEKKSLYDSIDLIGGGTPKTEISEYWNGDIDWLSCGDIATNHKNFIMSSEKKITEKGLKNSSAQLLPKFSTVISARGTVGKYCILSSPMTFSQSNYGIKPKSKDCHFFTYLLVAHSVEELQSAAYGSVFDTITTNTFKETFIKLPNQDIINDFEVIVTPYFEKLVNNQTQIRTLTQLRDTLLPKLMSGEVRLTIQEL